MGEERGQLLSRDCPESATTRSTMRVNLEARRIRSTGFPGLKKRGQSCRSWVLIDPDGETQILELDKNKIMRRCSLPSRDLRLLDPLFIYPSTLLGRENAIVVSLEQIRCIITAKEVILMNSLDASVHEYKTELCRRLQENKDQGDDLPFEFRALELALELTCVSLDTQVKELELEIYPVLDELTSSVNTLNLERVRKLKGYHLGLTQRVQKVRDEIEHLMDDDGDMAEMYLTEKKERLEAFNIGDLSSPKDLYSGRKAFSRSTPVSPTESPIGAQSLQRTFSSIVTLSKQGSSISSAHVSDNIDQLEMLLEAYFVTIDNTLSKLSSLKEYIDDTEDLINIKLGNVQNRLIQFQLLLAAATFLATIFASVTAVFGMNLEDSIFDNPTTFNWVLIVTGMTCGTMYFTFLLYFRSKKVFPM